MTCLFSVGDCQQSQSVWPHMGNGNKQPKCPTTEVGGNLVGRGEITRMRAREKELWEVRDLENFEEFILINGRVGKIKCGRSCDGII